MRIEELEVFLSVEKHRSISAAARSEHLTQPAVSGILAGLESSVGAVLLVRKMRQRSPLTLTREGELFSEFAKQTVEAYHMMRHRISTVDVTPQHVYVGCGRSNGLVLLPMMIKQFKKTYPDLPIDIRPYRDTVSMLENLLNGDCDIGLSTYSSNDPALEFTQMLYDPFVFVCPKDMDLPETISLSQLRSLPLVVRERDSVTYNLIEQALNKRGLRLDDMNVAMQVHDNFAIRQAVSMGVGCGFVMRSLICNNLNTNQDCRIVRIKGVNVPRYIYLVRRAASEPTASTRLFYSYAANVKWYESFLTYDPNVQD